ncbi:hypothetical protein U91I_01244 [alpha proteobacterium U9-1i]|nr:hypothetical protein U91I_01244 [alpha proteobacterium U9-1i]
MRLALKPHPDTPGAAISAIAVEIARPRPRALALRYLAHGAIAELLVPAPASPARTDELWKHTCFEAFVRAPGAASYCELNFSPSSQWAAYRFDDYRAGMRNADDIAAPRIEVHASDDRYELHAFIELPLDAPYQLALSAVIEDARGKSYWALAHAPGKPDFHHSTSFAYELSP